MFSQAFIKLFFPFVAAAVLIFIIAIPSPAQSTVVVSVVLRKGERPWLQMILFNVQFSRSRTAGRSH
jgi:hypothetical protein